MKKIIVLGISLIFLLGIVGSVTAIYPWAHATDASGTVKDEFIPTENVYGIGQFDLYTYTCTTENDPCSGTVDLYVVNARQWTGGVGEILVEVGDGVETVGVSGTCLSTANGLECKIVMPVTQIWAATTTPGKYDFAIDIDKDAILGQADPIDDAYIVGFSVLPEFTTIGAALVLFGAGLYAMKKRRK